MVLGKQFEPPDLFGITVGGVVTGDDQADVVTWVRSALRQLESARVLIVLRDFVGWLPGDALYAQPAWFREDEHLSKIAIVGHAAWRRDVLTLVAPPIRQLPIRYFETETDARLWLGVGPRQDLARTAL